MSDETAAQRPVDELAGAVATVANGKANRFAIQLTLRETTRDSLSGLRGVKAVLKRVWRNEYLCFCIHLVARFSSPYHNSEKRYTVPTATAPIMSVPTVYTRNIGAIPIPENRAMTQK